jgi:Cys-tRNA(Pro)/Cys-tRNA(Cys) deacylase
MKRLASAFGGKSAQMMKPADAERMSGYKVGRISPFGQIRNIGTAIEEQAMLHTTLHQWRPARTAGAIVARDAARLLQAKWAPLAT